MNANKYNINSYILFILLFAIDIVTLVFALKAAMILRINVFVDILPLFATSQIYKYYWILIIIMLMFILEKIYFMRYDFWGDIKRVIKGLFYSFLFVFTVITLTKMSDEYSRVFILMFFVIALFLIPLTKRVSKKLLFMLDIFKLKVKIVANSTQYKTIHDEIENNWYFGYKNNQEKYSMVIIASKHFSIEELQKMIKQYTQETKDLYVIPYMDHLDFSHTSIVDYSNIRVSAIHIENRLLSYKNIFTKYIFERLLAILILPLILLVHILIYLSIKLDSRGSNIFKQKRLGKDSKVFDCYKYRTMYENNQTILEQYLNNNPDEIEHYAVYHKYKNDPRVTRVGKFLRKTSLDELPQFYNVLLGDMSLIGPRPYMIEESNKIGELNEELILKVKPGITGLWQVSGRNELTFKQRINLDVWYIQNWSLWMDFVIFMKTLKVVVTKVGAK